MPSTSRGSLRSAPVSRLTADDIRRFVADHPPESGTLELKQALSTKDGSPDSWMTTGDRIGDRARNEILEAVVAFANAHGGVVLLGIEESDSHPKCAEGIKPVPRCADLANRLRLAARDCIDPELVVLDIEGIATESDGAGVVVIAVPQSRLAPHRLKPTMECYARRADRSERLTMREIQDLVMFRSLAANDIAAEFERRRERFRETVARADTMLIAVRVTAMPTAPLYIDRVFQNAAVSPALDPIRGSMGSTSGITIYLPLGDPRERPILRGAHTTAEGDGLTLVVEVNSSGAVEVLLLIVVGEASEGFLLPEWAMCAICHALFTADRFRLGAGAPNQEYAFEIEAERIRGTLMLSGWGGRRDRLGTVNPHPVIYPRMSFGDRSEIPTVIGLAFRDLMNSAGFDYGDRIFVPELPPIRLINR